MRWSTSLPPSKPSVLTPPSSEGGFGKDERCPAPNAAKLHTQAVPISAMKLQGHYPVSGSGARETACRFEVAAVRRDWQWLFWGAPRGQSFHEKRPLGKKKDNWKSPIKWNMAIIPPPGSKGVWRFRHTPATSDLSFYLFYQIFLFLSMLGETDKDLLSNN